MRTFLSVSLTLSTSLQMFEILNICKRVMMKFRVCEGRGMCDETIYYLCEI